MKTKSWDGKMSTSDMIYIWKPTSCPGQMIPRQEWKRRMLKPGVWGDEVVLTFASNIVIIPALRESSVHQGLGVQLIKSERSQNNDPPPLFLFSFSEWCPLPEHLFEVWAECLEDLPGYQPEIPCTSACCSHHTEIVQTLYGHHYETLWEDFVEESWHYRAQQ